MLSYLSAGPGVVYVEHAAWMLQESVGWSQGLLRWLS